MPSKKGGALTAGIVVLTMMAAGGQTSQEQAPHRQAAATPLDTTEALANDKAVTLTFQPTVRGYDGVRDCTIAMHQPDHVGATKNDVMVGWLDHAKTHHFKALIKFTDLNLPAGCRILSAKLTLKCHVNYGGKPRIAAYGLLQDFIEGRIPWGPAEEGQTTWNSLHHGEKPWNAPGAAKGADTFDYDGQGDYHTPADDIVTVGGGLLYTWDVTPSFRSQYDAGRHYGWILDETSDDPDPLVSVSSREVPFKEIPVLYHPKLTVTFVPPPKFSAAWPQSTAPKLINFYLGDPDKLAGHLDRLWELPFSGTLFHALDNRRLRSREGAVNLSVFGPRRLRLADYNRFIEEAKQVIAPHSPLTDNFVRVSVLPGTLTKKDEPYGWENRPRPQDMITMWHSDFDTVVNNFRVAAEIARRIDARGILFDYEPYGGNVFDHAMLADAKRLGQSEDETAEQVRRCAEKISRAINEVYPDMTWIILFSIYDERWSKLERAFMDGLIAAADPRTHFIDGHEKYWLSSAAEFRQVYRDTYAESVKLSAVPDKFRRQMSVGFGVFTNLHGWDTHAQQLYNPARWQVKLENALVVADQYVWVFTGGTPPFPNWLTGELLPQAYLDATWQALTNARRMRGFDSLPHTPDRRR